MSEIDFDPDVPITLGKNEYKLRFTIPALRKAEIRLGQINGLTKPYPFNKWIMNMQTDPLNMSYTEIVAVLWAGLSCNHPKLLEDNVANLFSLRDFVVIAGKIREAFEKTLPQVSESEPQRAAAGIEEAKN